MRGWWFLSLIVGCEGDADTSPPGDDAWFVRATLEPEFEHANGAWAGTALLDADGDGWLDIFVTNGLNHADALYVNQGDGTFVDVAAAAGLDRLEDDGAAVAGDLDNDGDTDLVINQQCSTGSFDDDGTALWDGAKAVYLNLGNGTFRGHAIDLGDDRNAPQVRCAVSLQLFDIDGDGNLDLLVDVGIDPDILPPWVFEKYDPVATDLVMWGNGDGTFTEWSDLPTKPTTGFTGTWFDLDGDGANEIVLGLGGEAIDVVGYGAGELTSRGGIDSGRGLWMGLAPADYDRDGDIDLYATNMGLSPYIAGYDSTAEISLDAGEWVNWSHSFFENQGGTMSSAAWTVSAEQTLAGDLFDGMDGAHDDWVAPANLGRYAWGWGAAALDADADGWTDVATTANNCTAPMDVVWDEEHGAGPGALLRNLGGGAFEDVTWTAGVADLDEQGRYPDARGLAVGDLDNDGYSDMVVVNRSYNPSRTDPLAQEVGGLRVWLSRPRAGHWLQVHLVGTESNRDGIGSRVTVTTSSHSQVFAYGAGGGTNSSHERLLTIGLGDETAADIDVLFPSGRAISVADVGADQRLEIREDGR